MHARGHGGRPAAIRSTWRADAEALGAGEILLTSIDRDGTMEGYDVELTRRVSEAVSIPVIASGGAGTYAHMAEVLRDGGASAVAAASMFHFTEQTPMEAKQLPARGRGSGAPVSVGNRADAPDAAGAARLEPCGVASSATRIRAQRGGR